MNHNYKIRLLPSVNTIAVHAYRLPLPQGGDFFTSDMTVETYANPVFLLRDELQNPSHKEDVIRRLGQLYVNQTIDPLVARYLSTRGMATAAGCLILRPEGMPQPESPSKQMAEVKERFDTIFAFVEEEQREQLWGEWARVMNQLHGRASPLAAARIAFEHVTVQYLRDHPQASCLLIEHLHHAVQAYAPALMEMRWTSPENPVSSPSLKVLYETIAASRQPQASLEALYTALHDHVLATPCVDTQHEEALSKSLLDQADPFLLEAANALEVNVMVTRPGQTIYEVIPPNPDGAAKQDLKFQGCSYGNRIILNSDFLIDPRIGLSIVNEELVHQVMGDLADSEASRYELTPPWRYAVVKDLTLGGPHTNTGCILKMYRHQIAEDMKVGNYSKGDFSMRLLHRSTVESQHAMQAASDEEKTLLEKKSEESMWHACVEALADVLQFKRMLDEIVAKDGNLLVLNTGEDRVLVSEATTPDELMAKAFPTLWRLARDSKEILYFSPDHGVMSQSEIAAAGLLEEVFERAETYPAHVRRMLAERVAARTAQVVTGDDAIAVMRDDSTEKDGAALLVA